MIDSFSRGLTLTGMVGAGLAADVQGLAQAGARCVMRRLADRDAADA